MSMQAKVISGGNVYGADGSVTPYVDELSRMHAKALEMAIRANIGRVCSYVQHKQWLDSAIDIKDASGIVLAVIGVQWEGLTARVYIQQAAEPSFIFA